MSIGSPTTFSERGAGRNDEQGADFEAPVMVLIGPPQQILPGFLPELRIRNFFFSIFGAKSATWRNGLAGVRPFCQISATGVFMMVAVVWCVCSVMMGMVWAVNRTEQ